MSPFAEEIFFNFIHQTCSLQKVDSSEAVSHVRYATECATELFSVHAYHFGLVRRSDFPEAFVNLVKRHNLSADSLPEFAPAALYGLQLGSYALRIRIFASAFRESACEMSYLAGENFPYPSLHLIPERPCVRASVHIKRFQILPEQELKAGG